MKRSLAPLVLILALSTGASARMIFFHGYAPPPARVSPLAQWLLTPGSVSGSTEADGSGNGNTAAVVGGPLGFNALSANFNGTSQYLTSSLRLGAR